MFTWICPKCGKEVPPSYSECPNCSPAQAAPGSPLPEPAAPVLPAGPEAQPAPPPLPETHLHQGTVAPQAPPPAQYAAPVKSGHVAVPGWMLSILVAAVLIIIGLAVILLRDSSRATSAQPAAAAPIESVPASSSSAQANPILNSIELTGLRLTEDSKHKPFVQFVVVNHSQADLGTIDAKVTLKAVAKQMQETVGTFAFKASLGPYESKDLKAPLETKLRVYELPDWQFLRTEIVQ